MEKLGEALKAIFDKFGNFFDILDLSFFVSGAVALVALFSLGSAYKVEWFKDQPPVLVGAAATAIGCYVLGLLCFAAGRYVRWARKPPSYFDDLLDEVVEAHGLADQEPVKGYLGRLKGPSGGQDPHKVWQRLYNRMWAEVRQSEQLKASFALLNRYWVMAATYDGMATALWVWAIALLSRPHSGAVSWIVAGACTVALVILSRACLREAGRYQWHQVEELAATMAYKLGANLPPVPPPSPTVADASPAPMVGGGR